MRLKENSTNSVSPVSDGLSLISEATPNYGISLNPSGNYTFATDTCNYLAQPNYRVMINNIGNQPTGQLNLLLNGENGNRFTLSTLSIANIAAGSSDNFSVFPQTGLAAGTYTAKVTVSGANNISASVDLSFTVNKTRRPVPDAPTLADKTSTSITLNTINGAQYRNGSTGEWQDSPLFNGLTPNTDYIFYVRLKANNTHDESLVSGGLSVVTNEIPTCGISLNPSGNHTFSVLKYGYGVQPEYGVVVSNTGNSPTGALNISLSGEGSDGFAVSKTIINDIAAYNSDNFTLVPNTGLAPGVYSATLTVSGANNILASFDLRLTVNKASQDAPPAPVLESKTSTMVILKTSSGIEYRNGNGEWQDSPIFNGLNPGTPYTFYARSKENSNSEASPLSDGLSIITEDSPSHGIALSPSGNHSFATDTCGYLEQPRYNVMVSNVGNQPVGPLVISLSGKNYNRFDKSLARIENIDLKSNENFTVVPVKGLLAGTYTATVTVGGINDSASFDLSFTVTKARQSAPKAPILDSKTATSITLKTIEGVQYRIGTNGEWQSNPLFENLTPYTTYIFYARMKETDTHEASASSEGTAITTYDLKAELFDLSVNNSLLEIADTVEYYAACGETSVTLGLKATSTASISLAANGTLRDANDEISLDDDLTVVEIRVISEDGETTTPYSLKIYGTLDAGKILYQRWDDVLAVNSNPKNNGNYKNIEGVRWYRSGDDKDFVSEEWFIKLTGTVDSYYAKINLSGKWHRICNTPNVRTLEKIIAYPNPISIGDNLNLHLPTHFTGGYMNVISLSGSTVKHKLPLPNKNNVINVSEWSPGIYLLNIVSPNGSSETVKIIIN
jgi:hypothetical protein